MMTKIVITKIQGKFKVGKHMERNFRYVGLDITQTEESAIAEQNNYISSIQPIPISLKRKSEKYAGLIQEEISELRAVIGQLNWLSTSTRPDISSDVLELSIAIKHPLVEDLIRANKLIHMLEADGETLVIDPVQKAMLYCYQAQVNDALRYLGQAIKFTGKCKVHCLLRHCQLTCMMQLMKLSTLGIS